LTGGINSDSLYVTIPINFGKWFLAMMNFVSISLLVSLEMVKFAQGIYIGWDYMIYDEEKDRPAKA
jgi:phospholipid-transporting ATPase